mmetsp:Transcript_32301/g.52350  ORF Transcript_32301/g.52350 Transcript_32301/m.52350 type:complete len:114 (-) Transcript_32301:216-557(-)
MTHHHRQTLLFDPASFTGTYSVEIARLGHKYSAMTEKSAVQESPRGTFDSWKAFDRAALRFPRRVWTPLSNAPTSLGNPLNGIMTSPGGDGMTLDSRSSGHIRGRGLCTLVTL